MARIQELDVDVGALERYLHEHIPLTRSMGTSVLRASEERVVLSAPLAPNINHRETVFGGSASALAILAGWTLVHIRLRDRGVSTRRIVIQRNRMEYLKPIEGAFVSECRSPSEDRWNRFLRTLDRKGMGRITLEATLQSGDEPVLQANGEAALSPGDERGDEVAGRFRGDYVAMGEGP